MSDTDNVIGAFSEEHAARLTGVSRHQLRRWDRIGFLRPSYAAEDRRIAFSRIYSFRDLVALRVLGDLRNTHRVPLKHLREVSAALEHMGDGRWTSTTLYVLGRRVVFDDPRTGERQEIVSKQRVLDIPLRIAAADMRKAIQDMNRRGAGVVGHIVRDRNIMGNEPVFARTRIPVSAVRSFLEAGYDEAGIIREYPDLASADIEAARTYATGQRAA